MIRHAIWPCAALLVWTAAAATASGQIVQQAAPATPIRYTHDYYTVQPPEVEPSPSDVVPPPSAEAAEAAAPAGEGCAPSCDAGCHAPCRPTSGVERRCCPTKYCKGWCRIALLDQILSGRCCSCKGKARCGCPASCCKPKCCHSRCGIAILDTVLGGHCCGRNRCGGCGR